MELPSLPEHGQFISSVALSSGGLSIRLVPETVAFADSCAHLVSALGAENANNLVASLEALRTSDKYFYVSWREGALVLSPENGDEVQIVARQFLGGPCELTPAELRQAMAFWKTLYENANEHGTQARARIRRIQELLWEQIRRTTVKSEGHAPNSAAGVLYLQHIEFMHKLLRAAEHDEA